MKKNYISPDTIEIKIQLSHFITTSDPNVTVHTEGSVDAEKVESRRRNDIWDDEEEDWQSANYKYRYNKSNGSCNLLVATAVVLFTNINRHE